MPAGGNSGGRRSAGGSDAWQQERIRQLTINYNADDKQLWRQIDSLRDWSGRLNGKRARQENAAEIERLIQRRQTLSDQYGQAVAAVRSGS